MSRVKVPEYAKLEVDTAAVNYRLEVNHAPWQGGPGESPLPMRQPYSSPWYTPKGAYVAFQEKFQPGSIKGSIFTLVVAIVGAGTLSLPKAFQAVGVLPAIGILAVGGLVAYTSLRALVISSKYLPSGRSASYRSLAQQSTGKCGAVFAQVLLMLNLFGTTVSYIVASGEITHICLGAIASLAGAEHLKIDNKMWIMVAVTGVIILPLSLCRDMSRLRFTSLMGVSCSIYLAVIMAVKYFQYCMEDAGRACFWEAGFDTGELYAQFSWRGLMTAFPLVVYGYTCHPNVLPLYLELQRPEPRRMYKVTRRSLGIAFSIYLLAGVSGYLTFAGLTQNCDEGKNYMGVCGNILKNDYHHDISMIVAAALVALSATLTVPLFAHAFRYNLAMLVYGCRSQSSGYSRAHPGSSRPSGAEPLLEDPAGRSYPARERTPADPNKLHIVPHLLITVVMLGAALVIAIVVSDISVVFGILGSTTNPLICYVLPTIFFLKMVPKGEETATKWLLSGMALLILALSACSFVGQIQLIWSG